MYIYLHASACRFHCQRIQIVPKIISFYGWIWLPILSFAPDNGTSKGQEWIFIDIAVGIHRPLNSLRLWGERKERREMKSADYCYPMLHVSIFFPPAPLAIRASPICFTVLGFRNRPMKSSLLHRYHETSEQADIWISHPPS